MIMVRSVFLTAGFVATVWATVCSAIEPEPADYFETSIRPVLVTTCGDCHDPNDDENVVRFLAASTADDMNNARSLWSNAAEQLRNRTMPPADADQPSEADRLRIAAWIEERLRATACVNGESAIPVTTRRLNRTEYDNTIRDLVGLDLNLSEKFPADGSGGEGFDNNGETLFLPPLLMERYLESADAILNAAIVTPLSESSAAIGELLPKREIAADAKTRSLAAGESVAHTFIVYSEGSYAISAQLADSDEHDDAKLAIKIDGVAASRKKYGDLKAKDGVRTFSADVRLTRGMHLLQLRNVSSKELKDSATIDVVELGHREVGRSVSKAKKAAHRRILNIDVGKTPDNARSHTTKVITEFMRRAFRRSPSQDEVAQAMSLYRRAEERGDPWEECVKLALKSVLVSPKFLFRIEAPVAPGMTEPLSPFELATRLSYFLWASMPDDELLTLAESGELLNPEVLEQQVDRLLDSPKSKVMSEEFVGQWLGTRDVAGRVAPDTGKFKGQFSTELLLDMRQEPVEMFDYVVRNNRPLLDLIDPDYAVLNERLAKHYDLIGKKGEKTDYGWPWSGNPKKGSGGPFQMVKLENKDRGGVLGMGGVHLLTSYPTRTSPVLRGGWVLETLLGVRVPAPPPDVPELKKPKKGKQSQREILAAHRENSTCAACHNLMDPVGFALDNFDVLGRWRDEVYDFPVEATATLPSGEEFSGPAGLKKVLLKKKDQFYHHMTGKMLGFALGRSLEDADDCTISRIIETFENEGGTARSLIKAVATSHAFRMKSAARDDAP